MPVLLPGPCICMQSVCDSGQCSSDGICSAPPASSTFSGSSTSGGAPPAALSLPRTNAPPSLQLAVPQLASVSVKRGAAYEWCGEGQDATASAPCEPGATAADDNDADIQSKVCGMPQADMFYAGGVRERGSWEARCTVQKSKAWCPKARCPVLHCMQDTSAYHAPTLLAARTTP